MFINNSDKRFAHTVYCSVARIRGSHVTAKMSNVPLLKTKFEPTLTIFFLFQHC